MGGMGGCGGRGGGGGRRHESKGGRGQKTNRWGEIQGRPRGGKRTLEIGFSEFDGRGQLEVRARTPAVSENDFWAVHRDREVVPFC